MSVESKQRLELSDYPGLMVYTDEGDQPPGSAVVQTNLTSLVPGQLQCRQGYTLVTFEEE